MFFFSLLTPYLYHFSPLHPSFFLSAPLLAWHSQAILIRALLEYSQSMETWLPFGLALVAGVFVTELIRSWTLAFMWALNYRTASRLRGAALTFAYSKILNLRNTRDMSVGEVSKESA